jgi:hypothetical protein
VLPTAGDQSVGSQKRRGFGVAQNVLFIREANMKLIITIVFLGLTLNTAVSAEEYPAAYFQPKIIFSADKLESPETSVKPVKTEDANDFDPRYPAANFHPTIIYISTDSTNGVR